MINAVLIVRGARAVEADRVPIPCQQDTHGMALTNPRVYSIDRPAGRDTVLGPVAPLVCTVILNWNRVDLTLDTLASLREQSYPRMLTIDIDNGSRDQAEALTRIKTHYPQVHVLASKRNLGFAGGCNVGMRRALRLGTDYLLLLNNDVTLHREAVARLVDALEADPSAGAAGPLIYFASDPERVWFGGGTVRMGGRVLAVHDAIGRRVQFAEGTPPRQTHWLPGTAIMARRSAVERVGLMDPAYFLYWEDVDWCFRFRRAGYKLLFVPGSVIWHKVNASTSTMSVPMSNVYYWERNRLRFIEKWGTWDSKLIAMTKVLWRLLAWQVRPPPDDPQAHVKLEAYRDYLLRRFGPRRRPAS